MSDEERGELEAMRAREAQWEAHLEEQEARAADAQAALWQQRRERDDMAAEWQAMKAQARQHLQPLHCRVLFTSICAGRGVLSTAHPADLHYHTAIGRPTPPRLPGGDAQARPPGTYNKAWPSCLLDWGAPAWLGRL